jgi:hypothetical protein
MGAHLPDARPAATLLHARQDDVAVLAHGERRALHAAS